MMMIWDSEKVKGRSLFQAESAAFVGVSMYSTGRAEVCLGARVEQRGDEAGRWSAMGALRLCQGVRVILRGTLCPGGPQKQMYIVGGSPRMLWRGAEGQQGWSSKAS